MDSENAGGVDSEITNMNFHSKQHEAPTAREIAVPNNDGFELAVRHWQNDRDAPWVLLLHGLCEHGGRHAHVAEWWHRRGWNVVIPDLRGHGHSQGVRTHVASFDEFLDDVDLIAKRFELPAERTALLGFSMGGLIAARYCQQFPTRFRALLLLSPLLRIQVPVPWWKLWAGHTARVVYPRARFRTAIDPRNVIRHPEAAAKRAGDPLVQKNITAGLFFEMHKALSAVWTEADRIACPVSIFQSQHDCLVDPHAASEWLQILGTTETEFRIIPEAYHELLHEPDWESIAREMTDWLEARVTIKS